MGADTGYVVTGSGRIDPEALGVTLPHEHIFLDSTESSYYTLPESSVEKRLAREPVSLENLWFIRRNPWTSKDNMRLDSVDTATDELAVFHRLGGDTVVDVTPKNLGGDPKQAMAAARSSSLNYVAGTSFYTTEIHPPRLSGMGIDEIEDEFVEDVRDGIGGTDVRAGIVGEIGLSGRIHDDEERVLRAGARAAANTGASVMIHPPGRTPDSQRNRSYPSSRWGLEILDIVEEEGLPPERVVMAHMDRTVYEDLSYQEQIADRGAYIEYDLWGYEAYIKEYNDAYLSDAQRLESVEKLVESGYADRLLFSHDVCQKIQLRKYGGYGYGHLLRQVVPALQNRGMSDETVEKILVDNPRNLLTFE